MRHVPAIFQILWRLAVIMGTFLSYGFFLPSILIKIVFFPIYLVSLVFALRGARRNRLKRALERLGPVFIKLGQSASLKPYLFQEWIVTACRDLQDSVSPVKINITNAMPATLRDDISEIDQTPIACGSIAQVYRATLKNGDAIAIKIIKHGAHELIEIDIKILLCFAEILNRFAKFKPFKLHAVVQSTHETLLSEQNLMNEARHAQQIAMNAIANNRMYVPKVYIQHSTSNILVTRWVDGESVFSLKNTSNVRRCMVIKNIISVCMEQIYVHGFFHADIHPGNILIKKDNVVAFVDFGIVGRLSADDSRYILDIIRFFTQKKYTKVVESYVSAKYVPTNIRVSEFLADIESIGGTMGGVSFKISHFMKQLFSIMYKHNIEVQEALLLVYKNMLYLESVVSIVDSNFDLMSEISLWIKKRRVSAIIGDFVDVLLSVVPTCIKNGAK